MHGLILNYNGEEKHIVAGTRSIARIHGIDRHQSNCVWGKAMYLYLVQHGAAVSKEIDPERPLSQEGRAEVRKVASYLAAGLGI